MGSEAVISRSDLVRELAALSHETYLRQKVRDHGADPASLLAEVHPHDIERAEDTIKRLEELGVRWRVR